MKSQKFKRMFLGVLVVILGAVWWDNLKLFQSQQNQHENIFEEQTVSAKQSAQAKGALVYKPPRVNPFRKPDAEDQNSNRLGQNNAIATVIIEKPSSRHKLLGVLKDKKQPQAVVNSEQGNTTVLSISDSLENWILIIVDTNLIVFRNEKLYDTLWLETKITLQ